MLTYDLKTGRGEYHLSYAILRWKDPRRCNNIRRQGLFRQTTQERRERSSPHPEAGYTLCIFRRRSASRDRLPGQPLDLHRPAQQRHLPDKNQTSLIPARKATGPSSIHQTQPGDATLSTRESIPRDPGRIRADDQMRCVLGQQQYPGRWRFIRMRG